MATGPEHYREAEECLRASDWQRQEHDGATPEVMHEVATAQVHATLALAAAPDGLRLRAENRSLRAQLDALEARLEELQRANEGLYAAEHDRTGGPALDPGQPFGAVPTPKPGPRPFGWPFRSSA